VAQPPKNLLDDRYELTRQILRCGETVAYIGRDVVSGRMVTIREFFAESIMKRDQNGRAQVLPGCEVQYKSLSTDYEELCSYLMGLPADMAVLRPCDVLWRNNTVYSVEHYIETETLDDYLARCGHAMSWPALKKAIAPIVAAVGRLHADGVYHRGISPETILVDAQENFLLSGFCIPAARTANSEIASTLSFGYSAPEQYSSNSWQGSWTDVYSLSAVCYRALTGSTPVEWRQRGQGRELTAPAQIVKTIPDNVSSALISGLEVDLRNRCRTIEQLWCSLLSGPGDATVTYPLPLAEPHSAGPPRRAIGSYLFVLATLVAVTVFSVMLAQRLIDTYFQPLDEPSVSASVSGQPEPQISSEEPPEEQRIVVPYLVGLNIENVLLDPLYKQLFVFEIERVFSETQPIGGVVSQQPGAGADPREDGVILVAVSKGSERTTMPNVEGAPLEKAAELLRNQEIRFDVLYVISNVDKEGTVLSASAPVGSILYRTTDVVTLQVSVREG
jgi:serine/threonine protein kinase